MQWGNIFVAELGFTLFLMVAFGFLKLPNVLRRRRLIHGFPWGYYPDSVPKVEPGYYIENDRDFMHDVATEFSGMDLGEAGHFSGFGELGEYGTGFYLGGE